MDRDISNGKLLSLAIIRAFIYAVILTKSYTNQTISQNRQLDKFSPSHPSLLLPRICLPPNLIQALRLLQHLFLLLLHITLHPFPYLRITAPQNPNRQQRRVDTIIYRNSRNRHPMRICTRESRLSSPSSVLPLTGNPMTGSGVMAAIMPGKCAAPPAR